MSPFRIRLSLWLVALPALGLAACQGNIGNGGLPLQAPQGGFSPNAQAFAPPATRERTLEGAVYLSPDMAELPLPSLAGFSVALELGTPPPDSAGNASPGPLPKASATASAQARTRSLGAHSGSSVAASASPVASLPSAAPSPMPSASGSAAAGAVASGAADVATAAASPAPAGSASASSGGVTKTSTALGSPKPGASASAGPKIDTKLVIYPDEAPSLPTPAPTGNVQVFEHRIPIVRAYVNSHVADLALYGLGAARFTVPSEELAAGRGFTIAVFEAKKKYKGRMLAFDAAAVASGSTIASTQTTALTLHKNVGYYLVLFGDQLAPTPLPSGAVPQPALPPGYATPATNPYGNYGSPNPSATINPYATPNPYATLNPYASPTPH